jgi:DNA modification methylase
MMALERIELLNGDNIDLLKTLPENSIDSVVTDPPYGLSFMNKKWDHQVPSVEFWREVFRVLKPGGHVLSFGGTRTYHRMTVNIEDAGFEIRDQIMWLYGSGFPKSHNIGKSVDKIRGNEREVIGSKGSYRDIRNGSLDAQLTEDRDRIEVLETKGTSEWEGWGTALKPANEPICVARKPLSEKTVAENVLKWGTGGINIDGCRIGTEDIFTISHLKVTNNMHFAVTGNSVYEGIRNQQHSEGRFPANVILDEEAGKVLDEQSGISKSSDKKTTTPKIKGWGQEKQHTDNTEGRGGFGDKGGASRFFYCPKVSKRERNAGLDFSVVKNVRPQGEAFGNGSAITDVVKGKGNTHPTVKPISLMAYLCRLVTPPNGVVLDAFMGSGSTGCAAIKEGFRFVGMEMDPDYFEIAKKRIEYYEKSDENVNEEKTSRASDEG